MGAHSSKDFVAWYQKKIGRYDKQEWEKTIDKKKPIGILTRRDHEGANYKNFIDLDLVQGASFTKAKPKHGFLTVAFLATFRFVFLPFYLTWWTRQTSTAVSRCILVLYLVEIIHIVIYLHKQSYASFDDENEEDVPLSEILIPIMMMWVHSVIQSQIGATSPPDKTRYKPTIHRQHVRKKHRKRPDIMGEDTEEDESSGSTERKRRKCKGVTKKNPNLGIRHHPGVDNEGLGANVVRSMEDDGFESLKSNGTSTSDSSDAEIRQRLLNGDCDHMEKLWDLELFNDSQGHATIRNCEMSQSSQYESSDNDDIDNDIKACLSGKEAVNCIIWVRGEMRKARLKVLDISSLIIRKVEAMPNSMEYFYLGLIFSTFFALTPPMCRFFKNMQTTSNDEHDFKNDYKNDFHQLSVFGIVNNAFDKDSVTSALEASFGYSTLAQIILLLSCVQRFVLSFFYFFLLSVAERTFKHRLLYAKFFTHLTSSRRARNSDLPHFRLDRVANIKTWLSVRSYLKKQGPLRSVDVIVSSSFLITIPLLVFLCTEFLKDSISFQSENIIEAMILCTLLGIYLFRFLTLGAKINEKSRNFSVITMEQINLNLQLEQKPKNKDTLSIANNVLKLASDLLKQLDSPFKVLGLSANPIVYATIKLIILSALSAVVTELLGFKITLDKLK
ncbi:protein phtf isoform X2 [Onthophagus taurus]|uniref:protein phtf isoform X2 n=1 Tax=Onthophagus taurus TaxID=166361 RepID=UPI000C206B32|nr:putative homeodomain transcription factor isoform X2 [Onthophagus taurus]